MTRTPSDPWDRMLISLAAAKHPHRGTGMGNLVNALVFAARASADIDKPHALAAQAATSELVEQITYLAGKTDVGRSDVADTVDYIVRIAQLPPLADPRVAV